MKLLNSVLFRLDVRFNRNNIVAYEGFNVKEEEVIAKLVTQVHGKR